jgi:hypothetical protein
MENRMNKTFVFSLGESASNLTQHGFRTAFTFTPPIYLKRERYQGTTPWSVPLTRCVRSSFLRVNA